MMKQAILITRVPISRDYYQCLTLSKQKNRIINKLMEKIVITLTDVTDLSQLM